MPLDADSINAAGICDTNAASKSSSRIAYDVATATESYKVRFETTDANLFIKEIKSQIPLPSSCQSSIIGKVLYENVPLGTGDNVKQFLIPSPYIETRS